MNTLRIPTKLKVLGSAAESLLDCDTGHKEERFSVIDPLSCRHALMLTM
jgi:hypothetical protein